MDMESKMNKMIIDVPTNTIEIIPLTDAELATLAESSKQEKEKHLLQEEAEAQAATDKAALLAKLGITADEFKTLLG